MLVSKNPYVVSRRANLAPKNPHFALKTGENFTQNLRLKSLIFIVEKYGKKLLSDLLGQKAITLLMLSNHIPELPYRQSGSTVKLPYL